MPDGYQTIYYMMQHFSLMSGIVLSTPPVPLEEGTSGPLFMAGSSAGYPYTMRRNIARNESII